MTLTATYQNDVRVYNVSGRSRYEFPDWLEMKHKKRLKKDPEYAGRVELVQQFEFPEASTRVKFTPDQRYIVSTGIYKPQIRIFELENMGLKFERHTDAETLQFLILDTDWTKLALLQDNKTMEFHTRGGMFYSFKIPKHGRDLAYEWGSCDLMIAGTGHEVFRLNLELGRHIPSFETANGSNNVIRVNEEHGLVAIGGTSNKIEYWDPRIEKAIGGLVVDDSRQEITALHFLPGGLDLAAGDGSGVVSLHDLRNNGEYCKKDHYYGYPIKNVDYHVQSRQIVSADHKIIKIWSRDNGESMTNIELKQGINDVCLQQGTGFLAVANEGTTIQSYYIPQLGPAPKWCSFLDNITEELEESKQPVIYDNYKFVTRQDLYNLGLEHLMGTNMVKVYMHGFFVNQKLYEKTRAVLNPFEYQQYKQDLIRKRIEDQSASRISGPTVKTINNKLADQLAKRQRSAEIVQDTRFSRLFQDPDYQVDQEHNRSRKYHSLKD